MDSIITLLLVVLRARCLEQYGSLRHCQSNLDYFAKTLEPDFATIDFAAFFRVDLSGSVAAQVFENLL
jgi:hypothetical protein